MSDGIKIKGSQVVTGLQVAITGARVIAVTPEQKNKLDKFSEAVEKIDKRKNYTLRSDFLTYATTAVADYITAGYKTQDPVSFLNELLNGIGEVTYEPEQSVNDDTTTGGDTTVIDNGGQSGTSQDGNATKRGSDTTEYSPTDGGGDLPKDNSAFSSDSGSSKNDKGKLVDFVEGVKDVYAKGKEWVESHKSVVAGGVAAVTTGVSVLSLYGLKKNAHPSVQNNNGVEDVSDFDKLVASLKGDVAMNEKIGDVLATHLNLNKVNGLNVNEDGTRDIMRYNIVYLDTVGEEFTEMHRFKYNNNDTNVIVGYAINGNLWVNLSK